jgi:hypothetical protein
MPCDSRSCLSLIDAAYIIPPGVCSPHMPGSARMSCCSPSPVIAINSAVALAARGGVVAVDWAVVIPFTATAMAGSVLGTWVAGGLPASVLVRAFAGLLVPRALRGDAEPPRSGLTMCGSRDGDVLPRVRLGVYLPARRGSAATGSRGPEPPPRRGRTSRSRSPRTVPARCP